MSTQHRIFFFSSLESASIDLWFKSTESRSNGGVLATPLSLKAAVGLPHPLSNPLNHHNNESTLWIENRTNWRQTAEDKESEARLLHALGGRILPEYAETDHVDKSELMPDYAEVDPSHALTSFQGKTHTSAL